MQKNPRPISLGFFAIKNETNKNLRPIKPLRPLVRYHYSTHIRLFACLDPKDIDPVSKFVGIDGCAKVSPIRQLIDQFALAVMQGDSIRH